jgi:hypothetical protein
MRRSLACGLLIVAGFLGCSDGASSPEGQNAATPAALLAELADQSLPSLQAVPDVPAALLAELADQSLPSLEDAARTTKAYGVVLESTPLNGQLVFDVSALPEEKASIRAALFRMLDAPGASDQKDFLRAALKLLAYFQEGVEGSAPLDATSPDGRVYGAIVETEVSALAYEIARRGHGEVSS